MRPYGSWRGTRTISPGNAMMRFTSISLGSIGELIKRASVREVNMKPDGMTFRRTVEPLHHLSRTRDVSWSRHGQRGLSLSQGKNRDSRWADHSTRTKKRQSKQKVELGARATHLHAPTTNVLDGVSIVHKCHVER